MANEQNLRPGEYKLSQEEAKKGGLASAEARRKKRDLRLALETLLEKDFKDSNGNTMSGTEAVTAKLFSKAMKGDIRAFIAIRDTVGQAPTQKVEVEKIEKQRSVEELKELFDEQ